jgi:DNA-binding beta-propeller fold protein YncE
MKFIATTLTISALAAANAVPTGAALAPDSAGAHALFVMTNRAGSNEIVVFERSARGALVKARTYPTGGGGGGSLTLSDDGATLLAANAGSGDLSAFRVTGARLVLTDRVPTGGGEPGAVAQHGKLVYVLDTAVHSGIAGFHLRDGRLERIPDLQQVLDGSAANPNSLAFTGDGRYLVATERDTKRSHIFVVQANGGLSPAKVSPGADPGALSVVIASNGPVLVVKADGRRPDYLRGPSYSVVSDGKRLPIDTSIPAPGAVNCWNVTAPESQFVYAFDADRSLVSGFSIRSNGTLMPLAEGATAAAPAASHDLDITVSSDGGYLYTLNAVNGKLAVFQIDASDGSLRSRGVVGGLSVDGALHSIAAT